MAKLLLIHTRNAKTSYLIKHFESVCVKILQIHELKFTVKVPRNVLEFPPLCNPTWEDPAGFLHARFVLSACYAMSAEGGAAGTNRDRPALSNYTKTDGDKVVVEDSRAAADILEAVSSAHTHIHTVTIPTPGLGCCVMMNGSPCNRSRRIMATNIQRYYSQPSLPLLCIAARPEQIHPRVK